jgi:hypothetical protein
MVNVSIGLRQVPAKESEEVLGMHFRNLRQFTCKACSFVCSRRGEGEGYHREIQER